MAISKKMSILVIFSKNVNIGHILKNVDIGHILKDVGLI